MSTRSSRVSSNSPSGGDLGDDAQVVGLLGVDELAGEQQLQPALLLDGTHDGGHGLRGEETDVHLGRPERRVGVGDDELAGRREAESARETVALHRSDGERVGLDHLLDELGEPGEPLPDRL